MPEYMKSTLFYLFLLLLLTFFACQSDQTENDNSTSRPNILFILADDLTYEAIIAVNDRATTTQVYEKIRTPHLDRLMHMGTTFTHTYNMGGWNGAIVQNPRRCLYQGVICGEPRESPSVGNRRIRQRWINPEAGCIAWASLRLPKGRPTTSKPMPNRSAFLLPLSFLIPISLYS